MLELVEKTKLSPDTIKRWLQKYRKQKENLSPEHEISKKYFSINDRVVLQTFFYTKTIHPSPKQLAKLSRILKKDEKKVRAWFSKERFLNKSIN